MLYIAEYISTIYRRPYFTLRDESFMVAERPGESDMTGTKEGMYDSSPEKDNEETDEDRTKKKAGATLRPKGGRKVAIKLRH